MNPAFLPGQHVIDSYASGGFVFGGMSHRGSLLMLPSGVRAWQPQSVADITEESLTALFAEPEGTIDFLIIGTGPELAPMSPELRRKLAQAGIRHEPMATSVAISTYNILLGERRRVAVALLAIS